jgi:hypothetical protein
MGFVTLAHKVAESALYTRLEYLESSGTQYIDTWYYPTINTRVIADVYVPSNQTTYIYGARNASSGYSNSFEFILRSDSKWQIICGGSSAMPAIDGVGRLSVEQNKGNYSVTSDNGIVSGSFTGVSFSGVSQYSMYLFGRNLADVPSLSAIRVYSFQIFDGEVLVRDLVPVKMGDGTLGMYDKANNVFYSNSGSGTFIAGAEVV